MKVCSVTAESRVQRLSVKYNILYITTVKVMYLKLETEILRISVQLPAIFAST